MRMSPAARAAGSRKVFRSTSALVFALIWFAFAALNLVDVAWRGRNVAAVVAAAVLVFASAVAYVVGVRPRIVADDAGLRVHNPLRDAAVPWPAVRSIDTSESAPRAIRVRFAGEGGHDRDVRAWIMQSSPRAQLRDERRTRRDDAIPSHLPEHMRSDIVEHIHRRTPADFVVEQLNELARDGRRRARSVQTRDAGGHGSVTWSVPAILGLAIPAAALTVAIVLAAL